MMSKLVSMYQKGAITADHLVVQCLQLIDTAHPDQVLEHLPAGLLDQVSKYIDAYRPGRMRTNYGPPPAPDQVAAAKRWLEAKVAH